MTLALVIAGIIGVIAASGLLVLALAEWADSRQASQNLAAYEAAMRAWEVQQAEFEAERQIRSASKAAVDQMLRAARQSRDQSRDSN